MAFDDDWKTIAARHAAAQAELYAALRRKHYDTAGWIVGVPPAGAATDDWDPDEPERTDPPTLGEEFSEHRHALLFNIKWAADFLPGELLAHWAALVAPLELDRAEAGIATIEAIRDEYQWAVERHEPPNSSVSRRFEWDYYVPRVGEEIDRLARLFRHVLSLREQS